MKKPEVPNFLDVTVQKGIDALENGDFDLSIDCFRKALKQAPFRQDIKDLLALALDRKPLLQKPVSPRKKSREDAEPKAAPRKSGIKIGLWLLIFSVLCLTSLAFFFFFSSAIQRFVGNIARPKEETRLSLADKEAAALYKTAELLQDQRRFSEAIEDIQKALEKNPTNQKRFENKLAELYFERGEAFYKKDDYIKAIESYKKAVVHNPAASEYHYGLGWAYYIQGRKNQNRRRSYRSYFEKSLKAFMKVLDLDPDNLRAKNALARVYIGRNETTKAAEMYRQIIRQSPESRDAERARRALKSMGFKP